VGSSLVSLHLTTQASSRSTRCWSFISSSPGPCKLMPSASWTTWVRRTESVRYGNTASAREETYECGCLVKDPWGEPCSEINLRVKLYLDSLDTFPSKSVPRFPRKDPGLSHPRSPFFHRLVLTLTHGLTPRWLEELSQFNMEIQHRPGKKHTNADALSRIPGGQSST
jgi:hypothetical protein